MNRQMLIRQMAERQQISKAQAKVQLQHILASLTQALSEGEKVYLPQFGTFELRYHLPATAVTHKPVNLWRLPAAISLALRLPLR